MFAISFAFISVAVGIFGTYDQVLRTGGPLGIWLWPIVAFGQGLVALVIAQFAARIALTGSSYQWASRLANPKIGWGFGWLTFCWLGIGTVAADNALASQAFMPLFGMHADEGTARLITVAVLLVQAVLVVASVRIVAFLNSSRGGGRSGDHRGAGDRADRRGRGHRPRLGREPHLAWCLRRRARTISGPEAG